MTIKLTRFSDIPKFTSWGNYAVDIGIDYLEDWLNDKINKLGLNLDPDYQRDYCWTEEQKVAYMEFVLRGGKSSNILLFNCPGWMMDFRGPFELVDGKQRINAILGFLHNEFPVFGSYYSEFTDKFRLCPFSFKIVINDLKTREEVLSWYLDINSGGTVHTDEELNRVRRLLKDERDPS